MCGGAAGACRCFMYRDVRSCCGGLSELTKPEYIAQWPAFHEWQRVTPSFYFRASVTLTCMGTISALPTEYAIPAFELVGLRGAFGASVGAIFFVCSRGSVSVFAPPAARWILLRRCLFGICGISSNWYVVRLSIRTLPPWSSLAFNRRAQHSANSVPCADGHSTPAGMC